MRNRVWPLDQKVTGIVAAFAVCELILSGVLRNCMNSVHFLGKRCFGTRDVSPNNFNVEIKPNSDFAFV